MSGNMDPEHAKALRKAFRMPGVASIRSRRSTITNAFVSSLMPWIRPTLEEIDQALTVLGMTAEGVQCAYCGGPRTEWDHLRPLVEGRRPTGFITEIANLVPACNKCNQSKRNRNWREWMLSEAKHSPTARGIDDVAERVARLEAYERWRKPIRVDFDAFVDLAELTRYWEKYDEVLEDMERCHEVACEIQNRAFRAIGREPRLVRGRKSPNHE